MFSNNIMAAAGNDYFEQREQISPIMTREEFEESNGKIKKLFDQLRTYRDGHESIELMPFRLYDSYEQYLDEQKMIEEKHKAKQEYLRRGNSPSINKKE